MVNTVILNYLRDNADRFPVEDLKKMILLKGYPESDFDEALNLLRGQVRRPEVSPQRLVYPVASGGYVNPKLFIFSIVCGFLTILFLLGSSVISFLEFDLSSVLGNFAPYLTIISSSFFSCCVLIYLLGFFLVGKSLRLDFLKFAIKFVLIIGSILLFFGLFTYLFSGLLIDAVSADPQTAGYLKGILGSDLNNYASLLDDSSFSFSLPFWIWLLVSLSFSLVIFLLIFGYMFSYSLILRRDDLRGGLFLGILSFLIVIFCNLFFFYFGYNILRILLNTAHFFSIIFSMIDLSWILRIFYVLFSFTSIISIILGIILMLSVYRNVKALRVN